MYTPISSRELLEFALQFGSIGIGEIIVKSDFTLRHRGDRLLENLQEIEVFTDPHAARKIARYDENGDYRPLKSAPNLRRGWLLQVGTLDGCLVALDFFYPAALGLYASWLRGTLQPIPFRETLHRQTGMYRITQLLTDEQAGILIAKCCNSENGCLRKIHWELSTEKSIPQLPASKFDMENISSHEIPLICREVCHLVISAARPVAKANLSKEG